MSVSIDLVSGFLLDQRMQTAGTVVDGVRTLDLSHITGELPPSLGLPTSAVIELSAVGEEESRSQSATWIECGLIKAPPTILTRGQSGITRKRQDYIIMIKTTKEGGRYFAQSVADTLERIFPNNLHLSHGDYLLTVQKSYQQASIYLDTNSGRWWNRIYVECEVFYNNLKEGV